MAVTHSPSMRAEPLSYYTSLGTWGVRGHAYYQPQFIAGQMEAQGG